MYSHLPEVTILQYFLPAFFTHIFFLKSHTGNMHGIVSAIHSTDTCPFRPTPFTAVTASGCRVPPGGEVIVNTHVLWSRLLIFLHTVTPPSNLLRVYSMDTGWGVLSLTQRLCDSDRSFHLSVPQFPHVPMQRKSPVRGCKD